MIRIAIAVCAAVALGVLTAEVCNYIAAQAKVNVPKLRIKMRGVS